MLFNSYEFIFVFLPIVFFLYFLLVRLRHEIALGWLVLASLFFYGWWNPYYLPLIFISMTVNFLLGQVISKNHGTIYGSYCLAAGITLNLAALAYFKYAGFLVSNINLISGIEFRLDDIILPLAISFFTFQQIAYLVDSYRSITNEYSFFALCAFRHVLSSINCRPYCPS